MQVVQDLKQENKAIGTINRTLLVNSRRNIYTACEDVDFHWDLADVLQFEAMWKVGIPMDVISKSFGRSPAEIFFLAWDRIEKGTINEREGGIWGRGN